MIINAPSLANCNFLELGKQVEELVAGNADFFHVDIMDGHYVPNLCFPVRITKDLKEKYPNCTVDIHLMATNPFDYFEDLQKAGADYVSFHIDSTNFVRRGLTKLRDLGMKAGAVINPSQRIDALEPYIDYVDYVVLMTVEPGYAGQKFMADALGRLDELVALRKRSGREFLISIDGGVDYPNARECVKRGAEIYVTGIYTVFNQPDGITAACGRFMREMQAVLDGRG